MILNNAGVMPHSPLERRKIDDWNRTIDINIKGVLYGIAAALPHMQRQKSGHIINVSSVAGHKVGKSNAVYAATKTAVRVISEGLRQEVKPWNLRTTIISPGAVATELPNSITEADVAKGIGQFYEQYAIPADRSRARWRSRSASPTTSTSTRSSSGRRGRNSSHGPRTTLRGCRRLVKLSLETDHEHVHAAVSSLFSAAVCLPRA